jgi:hypothetical protein
MWYHNQCIVHGNVSYGATTSVVHLAMCHTLPRPVPFIWPCVLRYHYQCLSPGNVSCGTITSAFHMAMCHTVPRPVPFTWHYVIRYHNQCNITMRHTYHDQYNMTTRYTVAQPVYFTWQYVMRYHGQCRSPGDASYGSTTSTFHMAQRLKVRPQVLTRCTFSVTWKAPWFSPETVFERCRYGL